MATADTVAIKVKLPQGYYDDLKRIQEAIGADPLIPAPSIHALLLKAVSNFLNEYDKKTSR